jgi:hypothetical protein
MADILIDSVSASFTGTDNDDTFRNGTGNLRDVTLQGLSGDDIVSFGSAVQAGTGDGGKGLGYSIGSSTVEVGVGQDTLTFSGQINSGSSKFNSTQFRLGADDDFALINGLASASAAVVKGNGGNDDLTFQNAVGGATATDFLLNGNGGDDIINVAWTGTEAQSFRVLGGAGNDAMSGSVAVVTAYASAAAGQSGLVFKGNKGDDVINLSIAGTSDEVKVNGNSGADTIVFTAAADITNLTVAGGKDADVISAVFAGANTAVGVSVQGNVGNDTAAVTFSGGFISGFSLGGGSGNDVLSLNNNAALAVGSANSILAGTGADTIALNLGGNLSVTGASGFVVDLGVAGASAVSGGTAGLAGGLIDVNLSAAITGNAGAGIFFRGSNSDDVIDINQTTGANGVSNATFSGESGADTITLATQSAGVYSAVSFNGGAGADVFTAQFGVNTNLSTTAGAIAFNGDAGGDSFVVNTESAGVVTAAVFNGGSGADSFIANLGTGSTLATQASGGTQFLGGSGADTIGIIGASGTTASTILRAGVGNDLITGTFASGGVTTGITADAGAGADTIAFTFSASDTAAAAFAISGNLGGVINGGADADSITVIAEALTAGSFNFGSIIGGAGADTITFGGALGGTADAGAYTGSINAGAGADSIIFSGNNVLSGGAGSFNGFGTNGSAGFVIASGDSDIVGFDTVFVSNNDVTGGQAQLQGTFGSAGFQFSGFNAGAAGDFNMIVATGGSAGVSTLTTGGAGSVAFGQAIYTSDGVSGPGRSTILTGGLIGIVSAGGNSVGVHAGTYILSGGSTLGQIFSSVDSTVNGRGAAAVFNVQNGSGGNIDGFLFVEAGGLNDVIVKFDSNQLNAGGYTRAGNDGFFSAGGADALVSRRATQDGSSGGEIFFGANVGAG